MQYTVCDVKWIKYILTEILVDHLAPIRLHCGNQAAIHIAENPVFHKHTKHVKNDGQSVRDAVLSSLIATHYVSTHTSS